MPSGLAVPSVDVGGFLKTTSVFLSAHFPSALMFFKGFLSFLIITSIPVSLFFIVGIVYCVEQLKHIRKKEALIYDTKVEDAV